MRSWLALLYTCAHSLQDTYPKNNLLVNSIVLAFLINQQVLKVFVKMIRPVFRPSSMLLTYLHFGVQFVVPSVKINEFHWDKIFNKYIVAESVKILFLDQIFDFSLFS